MFAIRSTYFTFSYRDANEHEDDKFGEDKIPAASFLLAREKYRDSNINTKLFPYIMHLMLLLLSLPIHTAP